LGRGWVVGCESAAASTFQGLARLLCCSLSAHLPCPHPLWLAHPPCRLQHRIYWSHRRTDDLVPGPGVQPGAAGASEHVAFQRMAHHAGLAYLDEVQGRVAAGRLS